MIPQDLPKLTMNLKQYALEGLARAGLTLSDCIAFFSKHRTEEELYFVKEAKERFESEGELEIDDTAAVSIPDDPMEDGAYVQAWVWVPKEKE